jgi:ATP-binding cassette subfamily B protein
VAERKVSMGPMGRGRGHMGGGMMSGPVEKAKDFKGTLKALIKYLTKYKLKIILVMIFSIGSTIFAIVGPKILGNATTKVFEGVMSKMAGGTGIDFTAIGTILLTLVRTIYN